MSPTLRATENIPILDPRLDPSDLFVASAGGKARHLSSLIRAGFRVPDFFCISAFVFDEFKKIHQIDERIDLYLSRAEPFETIEKIAEDLIIKSPFSSDFIDRLAQLIHAREWNEEWLAVRSSGLDEDGLAHSFAGQHSSYLYQRGLTAVTDSIRRCWASVYSARALHYRVEKGLRMKDLQMGVIIQKMVNSEASGVGFSVNPLHPLDRDTLVIESVFGLGEGLVSGELEADHYEVERETGKLKNRAIAQKQKALMRAALGGVERIALDPNKNSTSSLTDAQVNEVSQLCLRLEKHFSSPQDCEWAFEQGVLYCLQSRPITSIPNPAYYSKSINGASAILWDNSNIIESYNGVTSPLTFSFASSAYRQVYIQFCEILGVPQTAIRARESMFRNMLGLIRGRIYYNLANWYRLVLMLPGASNNKQFMETMMGVRQGLKPEVAREFQFDPDPISYRLDQRIRLLMGTVYRWWKVDSIIKNFREHFEYHYEQTRKLDFQSLPLTEHVKIYQQLDEQVLRRWHAPIINDYLCMIFFGLLKKLTEKWLPGAESASIQNDLLCGEGDLESTEPTKMLMRIASWVDKTASAQKTKNALLDKSTSELLSELMCDKPLYPELRAQIDEFLDRYGFRCINELKLEEDDLHDDPGFIIEAVRSYVKRKSYNISEMETREQEIRKKAESLVRARLRGPKLFIFNFVLKEARKAVKNRENLRFARTKIFGVVRHLFRGIGYQLHRMDKLHHPK
ncbi:MAG: hypothetical protein KGQ59_09930, partial [Bdellovibrionales bacterium]|nr:hypothetical protein [Bdellovibrionales bacterium]